MADPRVILLVEPNASLGSVISGVLKREGFAVLTATSPAEALGLCDEVADIGLLITDAALPGSSGVALARLVAERVPAIRILLLSSIPEESLRDAGIGAARVLRKPIALQGLISEARGLLGG